MSVIGEHREALAQVVADATGLKGLPYLPKPIQSRMVVVTLPSGRFLGTEGGTFGEPFTLTLEASIVLSNVDGRSAQANVNEVFEKAVIAVLEDGWSLESVEVGPVQQDNVLFLVATLTVSKNISL